ncbi:MAG: hypothetical protein J6A59_09880 [Lachnospiraceae bacterium]|nr:hypothetical protein [Lachnospiraceae bacterium]
MKRVEKLLNPILYLIYDKIYRLKGSLLEVVYDNKVGVYDLDKQKEIVPTEYISIKVVDNIIFANTGLKEIKYKWK